jgi:hypothetical protein
MSQNTNELLEGLEEAGTLLVSIDRAMERRLRWSLTRYYSQGGTRDYDDDGELEVALLAVADRGLRAGETDAGVWSRLDGRCSPLPRNKRAPFRNRLGYAWQSAVSTYRAT